MSSAPSMQLHAYSGRSSRAFVCQNTGSTLFRSTYKKVSPFALVDHAEACENVLFTSSSNTSIQIPRNGDLLSNLYMRFTLPDLSSNKGYWRKNVGQFLLKNAQLKIGSQKIDEISNTECAVWSELLGDVGSELKEMSLDIGEHDFYSNHKHLGPELMLGQESFQGTTNIGTWTAHNGATVANDGGANGNLQVTAMHGGAGRGAKLPTASWSNSKESVTYRVKISLKNDDVTEGDNVKGTITVAIGGGEHAISLGTVDSTTGTTVPPAGISTFTFEITTVAGTAQDITITTTEQQPVNLCGFKVSYFSVKRVYSGVDGFTRRRAMSQRSGGCIVYAPVPFWFTMAPCLSLPLVALMYHDVVLNVQIESVANCWVAEPDLGATDTSAIATAPTSTDIGATLIATYVLLSSEERQAMAADNFEMLCTQHQIVTSDVTVSADALSHKIKLNINHPVTCMAFVGHNTDATAATKENTDKYSNANARDPFDFRPRPNQDGAYSSVDFPETFTEAKLKLNGHDRWSSDQDISYFRQIQPRQHFKKVPQNNNIYCYSFAQYPAVPNQPSGHVNMSRIDNASLDLKMKLSNASVTDDVVRVSAMFLNLNILRFSGGLGGVRYGA